MNRQEVIICVMGVLLLSTMAIGLYTNHANRERINELESQLNVLRAQEKRSAVDRRVSKQMEQIAYGQQALSTQSRSYPPVRDCQKNDNPVRSRT